MAGSLREAHRQFPAGPVDKPDGRTLLGARRGNSCTPVRTRRARSFSDSIVKQPACIAVRRTASLRSPMHAHSSKRDSSSPLLVGVEFAVISLPLTHVRERSAERRLNSSGTLRCRVPCYPTRSPPGAPLWRLFTSGPCFRGGTGGTIPTCPWRLPPLSFHSRVQPLKADPRSRAGRLPEASRGGDCESQAAGATPGSANQAPLEDALT